MMFKIFALLAAIALATAQEDLPTPVPKWQQCGGKDYTGSTDCVEGTFCDETNEFYSLCRPNPVVNGDGLVPEYEQCGGEGFTGPTTCVAGSTCEKLGESYSQCIPIPCDVAVPAECACQYQQCGGIGFTGPTCCKEGNDCVADNEYYSACKPSA